VYNCATVQKVIAEAAEAGNLNHLAHDVREHVANCTKCAEVYFTILDLWACADLRTYVELHAVVSSNELPSAARFHVDHCDQCGRLLAQDEHLDRMLRSVTLSAQALGCPAVRPHMMRKPMTWKLALVLAIAALSVFLSALSMYRAAERLGWLYPSQVTQPCRYADTSDGILDGHHDVVK